MIASVTFEKTTYNQLPWKFEAGTANIAGGVGLGAAVDWLTAVGLDAVAAHEHGLLVHATERLRRIAGLTIVGTAREKAAVVSFVLEGVHPHDIGTILDQEGIAIRTGQHCAQPVMDRFGIPATARASFGLYNTKAEVDALVAGVKKVSRGLRADAGPPRPLPAGHPRPQQGAAQLPDASGRRPRLRRAQPALWRPALPLREAGRRRHPEIAFQGAGCAISKASASLMTDSVKGKTLDEAEGIFGRFHDLLTGPPDVKADPAAAKALGKLAVFSGVREFPVRVKCATLAWHTLNAALHGENAVSTE